MPELDRSGHAITILMADDDEDDRELTRDALADDHLVEQMQFVADGQDLLDYLRRDGAYAPDSVWAPRPSLILLDLNMPRKDGREALAEIKADQALCRIPVVVLTTSTDENDVKKAYDLGANSYVTKPVDGERLVEVMEVVTGYWADTVQLPDDPRRG
jgi:CheY-like chemotaxis protein